MHRRAFLKTAATLPAVTALSPLSPLASIAGAQQKEFAPRPGTWRTFEIVTKVEALSPSGITRVWVPIPAVTSDYQTPIESRWTGNAEVMQPMTVSPYGAALLYAEFAA